MAFVYNGGTGENVVEIQLSTDPSFINDVVITNDAVYFTNSFAPVIYKIPLGEDGQLPSDPEVITLTLTGDYQFVAGGFNANGIDALPNGKALTIVNSTTGSLYLVDSTTGEATLIDLNGGSVPRGMASCSAVKRCTWCRTGSTR